MERVIVRVHHLLIEKRKKIAVAESCTGGGLSELFTKIGGSSQYFLLGVVAYSNLAKKKILKVPDQILRENGSVSPQTTKLLARSIRKISGADIGIGITGIAGPSGGTRQKPVGTVFIAIDTEDRCVYKHFLFRGERSSIRRKASLKALEILLKEVLL